MLQSVGFTLFTRLSGAVLNFMSLVLLSRFLGPEARGICSWYLVVIAASLVFSDMVAGPAAGYLLRKHAAPAIRKVAYMWTIVPVIVVNSLFLALGKVDLQEFMLLLILCWLNSANNLQLHILLAKQKILAFNLLSLLGPLLTLVLIFVFAKIDEPLPIMYLHVMLVSWILVFISAWFIFKFYSEPSSASGELMAVYKDGFKYGLHNQAGHLAGLLNNRLVYFLVPAALLGVYANALSLGEAMLMLPGSMGQILYASVLNEKAPGSGRESTIVAWWTTLVLMLLATIAVYLVPDSLYQWMFGQRFVGVRDFLLILVPGLLFYAGYLIMSYWQSANGRFIYNFYATSLGLIVNIISCLALKLTQNLTPINAALSMAIGWLVIFIVSVVQFKKDANASRSLFPPPTFSMLRKMMTR